MCITCIIVKGIGYIQNVFQKYGVYDMYYYKII